MANEDKKTTEKTSASAQPPKAAYRVEVDSLELENKALLETNRKLLAESLAAAGFINELKAKHAEEVARLTGERDAVVGVKAGLQAALGETCPNGHSGARTIGTNKGILTKHCGQCGIKWKAPSK